jgi:rRNA processing protein Gar1
MGHETHVCRQSTLIKAARGDNGNRDRKVGERVEDLRIASWYRVGTLRDVFGPRKQIVQYARPPLPHLR